METMESDMSISNKINIPTNVSICTHTPHTVSLILDVLKRVIECNGILLALGKKRQ